MIKSQNTDYLFENASWLAGSVGAWENSLPQLTATGTIFLDFIVLAQFIVYAPQRQVREAAQPHYVP